ncbi:MAG TPA: DNA/RNA nuclease SfsA [Spirochaetota bacterium]|nr:DNA/RNA nuclease SfsA [Spirochaetota bacterium]HPX91714.1 DNA/RNA nuclease SfsA [Spirochaetota bacterium]
MEYYNPFLSHGIFLNRINRFVAKVKISGRVEEVYVPNTGRLSELALPGAEVLLSSLNNSRFRYKILYIIKDEFPVMIDSTYSNRLFHDLIISEKVPYFENIYSAKREVTYENHRFDFLIKDNQGEHFVEVKSCTLFYDGVASFPDAVSLRAAEHVAALAKSSKGTLVFFILSDSAKIFIPNYHRDYNFYKTLLHYKNEITIKALRVSYSNTLDIDTVTDVPVFLPEVGRSGIFILLFRHKNKESFHIVAGKGNDVFKGIKTFRSGKSSSINLSEFDFILDIPVITEYKDLSFFLKLMEANFNFNKLDFGDVLLLSFKENPAASKKFWEVVLFLWFGDFSRIELF